MGLTVAFWLADKHLPLVRTRRDFSDRIAMFLEGLDLKEDHAAFIEQRQGPLGTAIDLVLEGQRFTEVVELHLHAFFDRLSSQVILSDWRCKGGGVPNVKDPFLEALLPKAEPVDSGEA